MSPWWTSKPSTPSRFERRPVAKLSRMRTWKPSDSNRLTRCEPMKPAPPVTRTDWLLKRFAPLCVCVRLAPPPPEGVRDVGQKVRDRQSVGRRPDGQRHLDVTVALVDDQAREQDHDSAEQIKEEKAHVAPAPDREQDDRQEEDVEPVVQRVRVSNRVVQPRGLDPIHEVRRRCEVLVKVGDEGAGGCPWVLDEEFERVPVGPA